MELLRKLAPFRGMEGRFADDVAAASGGTAMRGGYNVEVVDGEWWVRMGQKELRRSPTGTQPFYAMVQGLSSGRMLIAGPWAALSVDVSGANVGKVRAIYSADDTESTTFTNASADAASTSNDLAQVNDMVLVGTDPTDECYRVTAVSAGTPNFTLDRPYTGTTGAKSTRYFRVLIDAMGDLQSVPTAGECSAVVIEQLVSHSSGALWTTNPAVTAGRRYLVFSGRGAGPYAIDLDNTSAPLKNWFRLTGEAADPPTELTVAHYCTLWKNRLWIAVSDDPTGSADDLTIYYSNFGDILQWHTGVKGGSYQHNFVVLDGNAEEDPLRAIAPLGEELHAYRRRSSAIITAEGSRFRPILVPSGFGPMGGSVVYANGRHFMITGWGPSYNDGRSIRPLLENARQAMGEFSLWDGIASVPAFHDITRKRVYWGISSFATPRRHQLASIPAAGTQSYTDFSYEKAMVWLCHDYATGETWFEDGCTWVAGAYSFAGDAFVVRPDGSVFINGGLGSNATGKDEPVVSTDSDFVVDAVAETPWLELNGGRVAALTYMLFKLRALDFATDSQFDVADILSASTIHLAEVDVFVDWSMTAAFTVDLTVDRTTMQALPAEGQRLPPIMALEASPSLTAKVVKLRFKNSGGAGGTTKGHFRISDVELWGTPYENHAPLTSMNRG